MFDGIIKLNKPILQAVAIGAIIAVFSFAISLAVIGLSVRFAAGLAAGGIAGGLCIFLLHAFLLMTTNKRKAFFALAGFFIRMILFAGVFYASLQLGGYEGAAGCAIAFLAPYVGVACAPKLQPLINKLTGKNGAGDETYIYEAFTRDAAGRRRFVFIKQHDTVRYLHGRRYVTHQAFHKVKEVRRDA